MPSFAMGDLDMRASYALLTNLVTPRPIALVSTLGTSGVANLAPFSYFMLGGGSPASLCFSPTLGRAGDKDTLRNIRESGEFVVNLVDEAMAAGVNAASAPLGAHESEWPLTGFHAEDCWEVKPQRVAEAPAAFECRLFQVAEHGEGLGAARYVIGEILVAHVREELLEGTTVQPERVNLLSRLGGDVYEVGGNRFSMTRPG